MFVNCRKPQYFEKIQTLELYLLIYLIVKWGNMLKIESLSALNMLFAFSDLILITLNLIIAGFVWKVLETQ